jgi:chemotaxis response regulator CheB
MKSQDVIKLWHLSRTPVFHHEVHDDSKKETRSTARNPRGQKETSGFSERGYAKTGGGDRIKMVAGKSTLPETSFPIVGIGASAGGLEALARSKTDNKLPRPLAAG